VLALYPSPAAAAIAARALHDAGVGREQISVIARSHTEEGALAREMDATPGVDLEDSRPAAVLGELSGQVLAAIALVLPGIGPIVTAGPLSAELGEAAGHAAGSVASVLASAGLARDRAEALEHEVEAGSILLAIHVNATEAEKVRQSLIGTGPSDIIVARRDE
jgi:hypothetical protein